MQYRAILFAALGLAACGTAPATRSELDSVVQFLLASAAADFRAHPHRLSAFVMCASGT
jgi:hypothetical protein